MAFSSLSNRPTALSTKTRQSLLYFPPSHDPSTQPQTPSPQRNNTKCDTKDIAKKISSFGYQPDTPSNNPGGKGIVTTIEATRRLLISSDEEDNDNGSVKRNAKKRRRVRNHHLADDSDDDMDSGIKHNSRQLTTRDSDSEQLGTSSTHNKVALLRTEIPGLAREDALQALQEHQGDFKTALYHLKTSHQKQLDQVTSSPHTPRHIQHIYSSSSEPDDDDDDDDDDEEERLEQHRLQQEAQTVKFYNSAQPQDIMDVVGCKLATAEKLIKLRPFDSIEDLQNKLKQERGLSNKFVVDYMEALEGYSAVDQIIQKTEDLGGQLQDILDVWRRIGSANDTDDKDDTGTQLVKLGINNNNNSNKKLNINSALYKDAMTGFLTQQPDIVNPEFKLKSYQITGVNWMLLLYRKKISGILADEMGLGKTAQVISFLGRLHELGESGPHMIVVPSSTLDNWMREFERFCPGLEVRCYYGSQTERRELQHDILDDLKNIQAVVTTYAIAAGQVEDRNFLRRLRCKSMILDEGHMVKNYTSARYTHLMRLGIPFRLLLTGTPLQNNLQELVSLLIFIMPNVFSGNEEDVRKIFKLKSGGGGGGGDDSKTTTATTKTTTSNTTNTTHATNTAQMLSRQRIQRAKKMMTPFVLRRRKAQVLIHLPKKLHHVEYCPMTPNQQSIYAQIVADSQQRYNDVMVDNNGNKKMDKLSNIVMQLRKAADHPLLFRYIYNNDKIKQMAKEIRKEERYWDSEEQYIYEDMEVMTDFELNRLCCEHKTIRHHRLINEEWMDSGKIQYLRQLLPRMKQAGNKVLLFSQFTSVLDILEPVMKTIGMSFLRLDGTTKVGERQDIIDEFNQNKSLDVFLLSTKAGGFGINLTSANVVVMYDMDFNPQNDKQAEDRAHRVGQTKDVVIYKLLSDHTIEHQILAMADIRLRLDKKVSGIDDDMNDDNNNVDNKDDDTQEMDQVKMTSLLKSALMAS